ncbi:MAG: pentapeptide repeat-containing protein [Campylobacterota bacterium]|nr:pentapeptide repeat-containing protein [Campylobacterota bacterium]
MSFTKDEYYDEVLENININKETITSKQFDNCIFKNCSFNETAFNYCNFTECSFENCDLSLVNLKNSVFNDINISNTKAIGINWTLCGKPFEVNFTSSDISMSSFYELDLRHTKVINCKAHDIDFAKTNLEKAIFKDTDLLGCIFGNTNLQNTDLTQAINYMIDPNENYIKSTKVSLPQATSFLKFFDLEIV